MLKPHSILNLTKAGCPSSRYLCTLFCYHVLAPCYDNCPEDLENKEHSAYILVSALPRKVLMQKRYFIKVDKLINADKISFSRLYFILSIYTWDIFNVENKIATNYGCLLNLLQFHLIWNILICILLLKRSVYVAQITDF